MQPAKPQELPDEDTRLSLYQLLGVPADLLAELVNDMRMWWDAASLFFWKQDDSITRLSAVSSFESGGLSPSQPRVGLPLELLVAR